MRWRALRCDKVQDGSIFSHDGKFRGKCIVWQHYTVCGILYNKETHQDAENTGTYVWSSLSPEAWIIMSRMHSSGKIQDSSIQDDKNVQ